MTSVFVYKSKLNVFRTLLSCKYYFEMTKINDLLGDVDVMATTQTLFVPLESLQAVIIF